jgi:hypothetical protein
MFMVLHAWALETNGAVASTGKSKHSSRHRLIAEAVERLTLLRLMATFMTINLPLIQDGSAHSGVLFVGNDVPAH